MPYYHCFLVLGNTSCCNILTYIWNDLKNIGRKELQNENFLSTRCLFLLLKYIAKNRSDTGMIKVSMCNDNNFKIYFHAVQKIWIPEGKWNKLRMLTLYSSSQGHAP